MVGIDIGTTNTKVALVDVGRGGADVRAVSSSPTPQPDALAHTLRVLLRRTICGGPAPAAVGIASMAETGVPLDTGARPLSGWVRWDRASAAAQADRLATRLGRAQLVTATGVRPSAKAPLATWMWLRENRADEWARMAHWAGVADLACRLLSGELVTDHTLAGRTMAYRLPSAADPPPENFDADLLAEAGLRPEQLPRVAVPGTVAGRVRDGFADCGLAPGTPVVIAGHDHAVGAYGAGVRAPGQVADSIGTAEAIISVVAAPPDPVAVADAGMSSVLTAAGDRRALLAGCASFGAAVKWWLAHEGAGVRTEELFPALAARYEQSAGRPSAMLVLPYLSGRQTPRPDPGARLRVLGRRDEDGPLEMAYALLEGLSLHARWMQAEQARLAGLDPSRSAVTVFGASAVGVPVWPRLKASVLPGPVRVVTTSEPVAASAALLAAVRTGLVDPAPCLPARDEPAPEGATAEYERAFERFVDAATRSGVPR